MTLVRELQAQLRAVRREMKERGIKRVSCFMGGHGDTSYRLNAECFRLQVEIDKAKGRAAP